MKDCENCEKFTICVYHNAKTYCPMTDPEPKPPKLKRKEKVALAIGWLFTDD